MKMLAVLLVALGVLSVSGCSHGSRSATISVSDFGVVGDSATDDGPAIRAAVRAAIDAGPASTLQFAKSTYRLGKHPGGGGQIVLEDVDGLTIEGNGSTLLLHPSNGVFDLVRCKDVTVRGFVIDFDPYPCTQGTIRAVDSARGHFDLEIHDGFPLPPTDKAIKDRHGAFGWQWGSVIDPVGRHRKYGVSDHFWIDAVHRLEGRTYRVTVKDDYAERLAPVTAGDRFYMPVRLTPDGDPTDGPNIIVTESTDCTLEDISIHSARNGMNFRIMRNEGRITLRDTRITFKPGTERVCTTWKDGMHVKDNRVGPLIEGCFFEGMLDDSINISANTAMASEILSETEFRLVGPPFGAGDEVMVFDPRSGKRQHTRVIGERDGVVTLADPVDGVIVGEKRGFDDIRATHFYNMSYTNNGFIVRDCVFKPQRRHALLTRSSHGVFENNTVDGVGGGAVWMGNEMGNYYEGPFPHSNVIRNNTIRNTQHPAIHLWTATLEDAPGLTRDILVENNTITVLPGVAGIDLRSTHGVTLRDNCIFDADGNELGASGVSVSNSVNVTIN